MHAWDWNLMSAITHPQWCFCPQTFCSNTGTRCHKTLDSELRYSADVFQNLQLVFLPIFGSGDQAFKDWKAFTWRKYVCISTVHPRYSCWYDQIQLHTTYNIKHRGGQSMMHAIIELIGIDYSIVLYRSVSSTNSINSKTSLAFGRSFMYIRNNKGPKMDTWGTPVEIYFVDDNILWSNSTNTILYVR